jgi:hypothetical protein
MISPVSIGHSLPSSVDVLCPVILLGLAYAVISFIYAQVDSNEVVTLDMLSIVPSLEGDTKDSDNHSTVVSFKVVRMGFSFLPILGMLNILLY